MTSHRVVRGVVLPEAEARVLETLVKIGQPATAPQIVKAMKDKPIGIQSVYTLLYRLQARKVAACEEMTVEVAGARLRRVNWRPA